MKAKDKTYWISFSKKKSLGVCIVDAPDVKAAHLKTIKLGINPGGEIMFIEFDDSPDAQKEINRWGKNRLISSEELEADQYLHTGQLNEYIQDALKTDPAVTVICNNCNDETKP